MYSDMLLEIMSIKPQSTLSKPNFYLGPRHGRTKSVGGHRLSMTANMTNLSMEESEKEGVGDKVNLQRIIDR